MASFLAKMATFICLDLQCMKLKVYILLLFLGLGGLAHRVTAQEPEKKSSFSKLKSRSEQEDVNIQIERAQALKEKSPQEALNIVKDALAMSILKQDYVAESKCYNLLGSINLDIKEWKLAQENFLNARKILTDHKLIKDQEYKNSLLGLAASTLQLGQLDAALGYYRELQKLRLTNAERAQVDIGISEVYYQQGHYDKAVDNLDYSNKKAVEPAIEGQYDNQRAKILARDNKLEESYENLKASQSKTQSSKARPPKVEEEAASATAKDEIVEVLEEQKRYDEKIDVLNSSIEFNRVKNNFSEVSKDKVELGKTFIATGETSNAIRELEEAAFIADTIGDPARQANAYLSLAEVHERRGDSQRALDTYKRYSLAVAKSLEKSQRDLQDKSSLIRTQRDIEEVSKYVALSKQEEQLAQAVVFRQKLVIFGLVLIIMIIAVTSYFIYKNALASKTANQLLALKSLRSQMNPHFIFNALNSVNHFVSQNDERTANRFLSEFSRLMRLVMEHSQEDFIPLNKEEEIISLYLKLEHYRFRDKFDYEIILADEINREAVMIPPMLIQPYIENAVWHGLRYRESRGFLSLDFSMIAGELKVRISDNGIGRKRSAELKTDNQKKQQSTGLRNIRERLTIINKVYKTNYRVVIEDLPEDSGTAVTLFIPINSKAPSYA
jgi:tetratricopeptide (TPR) repeat protein